MGLNIRELPKSGKITEPGIYNLNINEYHSDICDAPSFSSGDLVTISRSGEEYWYTSPYNPDREKPKHRPHLNFGNAAHARILDPNSWQNDYILRPKAFKSYRGAEAANWRMVKERDGLIAITEEEVELVDYLADRIQKDPTAQAIFSDGYPELSLFCRFEDIWIKARPDMMPIYDLGFETDYKTTADNSLTQVDRDIDKWGYDQKLANIAWVKRQLKDDFPDIPPVSECAFSLIFQKSKRPAGITCVDIFPEDIIDLTGINLKAAKTAAACMRGTEEWSGYTDVIHQYRPKPWIVKRRQDLTDAGHFIGVDDNLNPIGDE